MDSTNRVALELARAGAPEGLVVVAGHQTAGRGRHGRTWDAAPGSSLLLSVLLRPGPALPPDQPLPPGPAPPERSSRHGPALPPERSHLAVAAVSLAARHACSAVAGFTPALKWPNDLMVGDAKVAGVLAEVAGDAVVVGLGLNVSLAGPWPPGAASAEGAAGRPIVVDQLLDGFLVALAHCYGDWPAVASDHRRACATLGRTVRVDLADESFTGTAADITDDGHLLVDVGMCIRTITAGDVVHLRPTPEPY